MPHDIQGMTETLLASIEALIGKRCEALAARVAELESRAPLAGPPGEPGAKGEPGFDGKSIDAEDVKPMLAELVAALPPAAAGPAGQDGAPGAKGEPGSDGKTLAAEDVLPMLSDLVAKAAAAIPAGRDGQPGGAGTPGHDGSPGKDGEKGADGRDGFGLEDFTVELGEDGRTLGFKFVRGDVVKGVDVVVPWPVDRGPFKPSEEYAKGDGVTHNGCWWIAREDAPKDVPGTSSAWRLAVKAGRDGKDLRPEGAPPPRDPIRMR